MIYAPISSGGEAAAEYGGAHGRISCISIPQHRKMTGIESADFGSRRVVVRLHHGCLLIPLTLLLSACSHNVCLRPNTSAACHSQPVVAAERKLAACAEKATKRGQCKAEIAAVKKAMKRETN